MSELQKTLDEPISYDEIKLWQNEQAEKAIRSKRIKNRLEEAFKA